MLAALGLALAWGALALAQTAATWEPTALVEAVDRVFVTASGRLYAHTGRGLLASPDHGESWEPLLVPAVGGAEVVAVDPNDDAVLYARAEDGMYRSPDGGWSWVPVFAAAAPVRLVVSPADSQVLYLAHLVAPTAMDLLRSADGGLTWSTVEQRRGSLCGFRVLLLEPHPGDAAQVFRTAECYSGRSSSGPLELSVDGGARWSVVLRPPGLFASRLVGGGGVDPSRFYLAANGGLSIGTSRGGAVYRSDDSGRSWVPVLSVPRASVANTEPVRVAAIAFDPWSPDEIYAAVEGAENGVLMSGDAGAAWTQLGGQELGTIEDLAIAAGGSYVFAATASGVWRTWQHHSP